MKKAYLFPRHGLNSYDKWQDTHYTSLGFDVERLPYEYLFRLLFSKDGSLGVFHWCVEMIIEKSLLRKIWIMLLLVLLRLRKCKVHFYTHNDITPLNRGLYVQGLARLLYSGTHWSYYAHLPNIVVLGRRHQFIEHFKYDLSASPATSLPTIVLFGNVRPYKKYEELKFAVKELSGFSWKIIGSGEKEYIKEIRLLYQNMKNVEIADKIYSDEELENIISVSDVFWINHLSERRAFVSGVAVLALSMGCRIIVPQGKFSSYYILQYPESIFSYTNLKDIDFNCLERWIRKR